MTDRANQLYFYGQGVQNAGHITVGGDLNIGVPNKNCLSDLRSTDPRYDKKRIEQTKGGLLRESYRWILTHDDFLRWRDDPESRLLWIKGDPGKGKTMLLCGIIDELTEQTANTAHLLSFFFCQATDDRLNNAKAVLRGLIYLLVDQQRSLISHIQEKYDHAGKALFEDVNAWVALSDILTGILQDPSLPDTTLVIDALDECRTDFAQLLDLIIQPSVSSRVKWIVSSRNWPHIEGHLDNAPQKVRICLELNELSISHAVRIYIQYKVDQLARLKRYTDRLRDIIEDYMVSNASDTFLWVALVCQALADPKVRSWNTLAKLRAFPPGLDSLYGRMMDQIMMDQIIEPEDVQICKQILAVTSVVYRPLTLRELTSLVESLDDFPDSFESLEQIIKLCGSFLTLREETIFFVHQSAKDYLLQNAANKIFPSCIENEHYAISLRSLQIMSRTLQRDIYRLNDWGLPTDQVTPPDPDPLAAVRYSCIHWVDHLAECKPDEQVQYEDVRDGGIIDTFLRRHYLHWLEALSILGRVSEGILVMSKLNGLFQPAVEHNWSPCLLTLEGHGDDVSSVAFSPEGSRLVSGSFDGTIKIWDAATGACLSTLTGHDDSVSSVAFSPDGSRLASGSSDGTVKVWDATTGAYLSTVAGHGDLTLSVAFSSDGSRVASGSSDGALTLSVAFSPDGSRVASGSSDGSIKVWDAATGVCLSTLAGHGHEVCSVTFSPDGSRLASGSGDGTVKVWDAATGAYLLTLKGHRSLVNSVAFSPDGSRLASGSSDGSVKVWDAATGASLSTFEGHSSLVNSVAFSPDGSRLASGSSDHTVKIWDAATGAYLLTLKGHRENVSSVAFLPDGNRLASGSYDGTVKVWNVTTGACLSTLEGHGSFIYSIAFLPDSNLLASGSGDSTIKLWDAATGAYLSTFAGHGGNVYSVAFSPDGSRLASGSLDGTVKVWDAATGACLSTLKGHRKPVYSATDAVLVPSAELPQGAQKVEEIDFNDFKGRPITVEDMIQGMRHMGFQASSMGEAVRIINDMRSWRDPETGDKTTIFLGASGAELRSKGLNRIGNLMVPNANYCAFEDWVMPILDNMLEEQEASKGTESEINWTPSKVIHRLGKEINDERSVYYWAYKNGIPVFCPALTDGSLGDMLYFHTFKASPKQLKVDIVEDIRRINTIAVRARRAGMIILGGGVVKHHIANACLMRNGAESAVYINTAQEFDGSDAGARPDEAISWGKIKPGADHVKSTVLGSSEYQAHSLSGLMGRPEGISPYEETSARLATHQYLMNASPAIPPLSTLPNPSVQSQKRATKQVYGQHHLGTQASGCLNEFGSQLEPASRNQDKARHSNINNGGITETSGGGEEGQEAQKYVLKPRALGAPLRRSNRVQLQQELTRSGEPSALAKASRKSQSPPPPSPDRLKTKSQIEFDTGYRKLGLDVNVATGFEKQPETKQEFNQYFRAALIYLNLQQQERHGTWRELEKGEEYIHQMGKQQFRLRDEEEDIPAFKKYSDPPPVRTKSKGVRKTSAMDDERQERAQKVSDSHKKHTSDDEAAHAVTTTTTPHSSQTTQRQDGRSSKKRRLLTDELQTSLAGGWDAHVDDEGRRPARSGKRRH
ncbi:hypothetical protein DL767_007830 [Monosporascus sp. MG133]|nr:hypothetical protein DL767_007830 [Monosporascus sp. MG133]